MPANFSVTLLLVKLHRLGIRGEMWRWIAGFLNKRQARCYLKGKYGPLFGTSVGLPQGSVISPVLFSIYLQDIFKDNICKGVKYADDGTIWSTGKNTEIISKEVEEDLKRVYTWTSKWRMKLNIQKTEICLFSKISDNDESMPVISLEQTKIKYNPTPKLLGVYLDETLNFQTHVSYVEQKAKKAVSLMRQVKHVEKISTVKLLQLYKALVLPVVEYASPVWQSADATRLDEVQRKCLSFCIGALGSSGREALEVELNVKPLEIRRAEISLREAARIISKDTEVPIKNSWQTWLDEEKAEKYTSPFGKMQIQLEDMRSDTGLTMFVLEPEFSFKDSLQPTLHKPEYWNRLGSSKSRTQEQKDESRSIISDTVDSCSPDTLIAFTDGSCHPNPGPCGAGACLYLPYEASPVFLKQPVSSHGSILLGELVAIKMVLDFVIEKMLQRTKFNKILILSDSQSSVGLLTLGWKPNQHIHTVKEILQELSQLKRQNIDVEIKWTPGHAEIKGNEEADRLAKEASNEAESMAEDVKVLTQTEFRQAAKIHGLSAWQRQWDASERGRFLYGLKPKVNIKATYDYPDRKSYNSIAQLRMGYARLNDYKHKIGLSDSGNCSCGEIETVDHFLLNCENYFNEREQMRTDLFHQAGITELTTNILLGCDKSDLQKEFGHTIILALSEFLTQTGRL